MRASERLGVGFIGSGFMTRFHLRSWVAVRDADVLGVWSPTAAHREDLEHEEPPAVAARGRFARNAVVQGAAAELFKMWAVTVRAALPPGAEVVLALHDELLVHCPAGVSEDVAALLHDALGRTSARWAAGSGVRLVADVSVVARWSDAKD
jgi:DNA polymerase I-like protein with 3'-5' exonuclease and polymerase domains